jgi:hypothetical protein
LPWTLACILVVQIISSPLSSLFFWFEPIDPPSRKWCHVGLASICHFLVLDPHLKAMGSIYGSQPIGLLYFIGPWNLDPHVKWLVLKVKHKNAPIPTPCDLCMFRFMIMLTSCSKRVKAQGLGHSQNMRLTVGVPYFGNDPTLGPYPTLRVLLQASKFNSVPTIMSLPLA